MIKGIVPHTIAMITVALCTSPALAQQTWWIVPDYLPSAPGWDEPDRTLLSGKDLSLEPVAHCRQIDLKRTILRQPQSMKVIGVENGYGATARPKSSTVVTKCPLAFTLSTGPGGGCCTVSSAPRKPARRRNERPTTPLQPKSPPRQSRKRKRKSSWRNIADRQRGLFCVRSTNASR